MVFHLVQVFVWLGLFGYYCSGEIVERVVSEGSEGNPVNLDEISALIPGVKFVEVDSDNGWYSEGVNSQPFDTQLKKTLCQRIEFDGFMPVNTIIQISGQKLPVKAHFTVTFGVEPLEGERETKLALVLFKLETKTPSWPLLVLYEGHGKKPIAEMPTEISLRHNVGWTIMVVNVPGGFFINAYVLPFSNDDGVPKLIYSRRILQQDAARIKVITVPSGLRKYGATVYVSDSAKFATTEANGCMDDD